MIAALRRREKETFGELNRGRRLRKSRTARFDADGANLSAQCDGLDLRGPTKRAAALGRSHWRVRVADDHRSILQTVVETMPYTEGPWARAIRSRKEAAFSTWKSTRRTPASGSITTCTGASAGCRAARSTG